MAEADLDGVIRSIAKTQHKVLMDAAKKRQGRLMELSAKAKDKAAKAQLKQTAKDTLLLAGAAARRMQIAAENAADSYARAVKKAAEDLKQAAEAEKAKLAKKAAEKAAKPPAKKEAASAKKAAKKSKA
jgi:pyruvate/2-oxoglutarate/acetoin dehydrogenase E1 component